LDDSPESVALMSVHVEIEGLDGLAALFGDWGLAGPPLAWYADWMPRMLSPYQFNPFDLNPLRDIHAGEVDFARLRAERDPVTGAPVYTPLVAIGLMVFYVYALMCMSTTAITVREAGGGRIGWQWAAIQFGYMLVLAYVAAWLVYAGGRALGFGE
jgi:hypothetical protein